MPIPCSNTKTGLPDAARGPAKEYTWASNRPVRTILAANSVCAAAVPESLGSIRSLYVNLHRMDWSAPGWLLPSLPTSELCSFLLRVERFVEVLPTTAPLAGFEVALRVGDVLDHDVGPPSYVFNGGRTAGRV